MPDFNRTELSALPINVAINTLIEESARVDPEKTRGYLGASILGNICWRRIQYDWMCDPEHSLRLRDIFDRGHFFEAQSRERFIQAGFKFAEADRLKFEALDGMLHGHADGVLIDGPKIPGVGYPCIWEHKGVNSKGWRGLERDGLEKAYPQYAVQIALYQKFLGVDEHPAILTVLNADSCERLHVLVPYDADCAKRYTKQAQHIIEATRRGELLDRFTDKPDHFRCKMCGHRARCWRSPKNSGSSLSFYHPLAMVKCSTPLRLTTVLGIHQSKQRDIDAKRLGRCMRRLGWAGPKNIQIGNNVSKGYFRSA